MLRVINTVILIYLLAPIIVVVATAFGSSPYPVFPPTGLTLKWFDRFLSNPDMVRSTELSETVRNVGGQATFRNGRRAQRSATA